LLARLKRRVTPAWDFRFPPYRLRTDDIVVHGSRDETTLRRLGVQGAVIASPGHTVDSISVLLDSGDAFVGDAAANFLGFAQTRHCVVFVTDLDEYYRSWQRLIEAGARTIHPAHGRAFGVERLRRDMWRNPRAGLVPFADC
jgi:glyoxylase-like metal-dependent hydrolase (beta-lactamase superfamily II)